MLESLLKREGGVCGGSAGCCVGFGELPASLVMEKKLEGLFEVAEDDCEGCTVVSEVEEKLNEGFGCDGA